MAKMRNNEDYTISETGNWNVADNFSKVKIMRPLENSDIYEKIARYGYDSFFEELINYEIPVDELRVRGLQRLIDELILLIKNCEFAMKKQGTKEEIKQYEKDLKKIREDYYPRCYKRLRNESNNTTNIKIDEKIFNLVLHMLGEIKSNINNPLNKNHLIFVDKEEFDPAAFKARIKHRIVNKG